MRYLSLFSGIEAASQAWKLLGWEPAGFAEVDPFASAVLAQRHPEVPNLGDVSKIDGEALDRIGQFWLMVFGWPCQDLSVAGKRRGLEGKRSGLFYEATRIVRLAAERGCRWFVAENVPGLLSSNGGRDFGEVIRETTGCTIPVPSDGWRNSGIVAGNGGGWSIAWRVLDAQFFGVPQRRRRVFVVGYLGDWRPPAAVLFERESLRGNPAKGRKAKQEVATALRAGTPFGDHDGDESKLVACGGNNTSGPINVATAVRAKGGSGHGDFESETFIACTLSASDGGVSSGMHPVVAIQERAICENPDAGPDGAGFRSDGKAYTLEARTVPQAVAFDTTQITSPHNRCQPQFGDPCHPLAAHAHPPAIAFNARQDPDAWTERTGPLDTDGGTQAIAYQCHGSNVGPMGTLRSGNGNESGGVPFTPFAFSQNQEGQVRTDAEHSASNRNTAMAMDSSMAVRRLTPLECERLQGFPDNWTAIQYRGKPAADGPRYKAIGNSMAVPVMRWIGERIQMVDDLIK